MGRIDSPEPSRESMKQSIAVKLAAKLVATILLVTLVLPLVTILMPIAFAATPTAAFTASPTSGCSALTVTFTDTSSGNGKTITKWEWDFNGDGTIERTDTTKPAAFTYIYVTPGTFSAKLKVTTSAGTNTKTTSIIVYGPPTASFSGTPTSGCGPLAVTFTDSSVGNSKTISRWDWDLNGDGTIDRTDTTTPAPFIYTYTTPGIYTAKLTVTIACGTNTKTLSNYIAVYGPPAANFSGTPISGCVPLTVAFTDASGANGRTITGWTWDFGDSTAFSGQSPQAHVYSNPGNYSVKLTVTTLCGTNTKNRAAYITVYSLPKVVPGTYGPVCTNSGKITLGGTPVGGTWHGDGVSGNSFDPVVAGPGDHLLTYVYTNNNRCNVSNTTAITVVPLPLTTITVD